MKFKVGEKIKYIGPTNSTGILYKNLCGIVTLIDKNKAAVSFENGKRFNFYFGGQVYLNINNLVSAYQWKDF